MCTNGLVGGDVIGSYLIAGSLEGARTRWSCSDPQMCEE